MRTRLLLLPLALAALSCAPAERHPVPAQAWTIEPLARTPADQAGCRKLWRLEHTAAVAAWLVVPECKRESLRYSPYARLRLLVLNGSLRVRAGTTERLLGPGAYASIPRGILYRLTPSPGTRYLRFLTPNIESEAVLELGGRGP